jgi:hypothetical protein
MPPCARRSRSTSRLALAAIVATLAPCAAARGQTTPPFQLELSTPDNAAFSILGVSPAQIERPTTPKALSLSLLAAATDDANLIPNEYAVAAAPFWMRPNRLTIDQYVRPSVGQSLAQTFTISFATTPSSGNTDVGLGFSTSPLAGHGSAAMADALAILSAAHARYLAADGLLDVLSEIVKARSLERLGNSPARAVLQRFIDHPTAEPLQRFLEQRYEELLASVVADRLMERVADPAKVATAKANALRAAKATLDDAVDTLFASDPLPFIPGIDPTIVAYRALGQLLPSIGAMRTSAEASMKTVVSDVHAEDKLRMGWMLGVSAAFASRVPNDEFTGGRYLRNAFWITPAYRHEATHVEVIGLVKWTQRNAAEGPDLFDFGARAIKQGERTSAGAEFLGRSPRSSGDTSPLTQRLTVNADYRVAGTAFVTFAFGKDFADPSAGKPTGGLVSILGVSIGLSKNPSVGQ